MILKREENPYVTLNWIIDRLGYFEFTYDTDPSRRLPVIIHPRHIAVKGLPKKIAQILCLLYIVDRQMDTDLLKLDYWRHTFFVTKVRWQIQGNDVLV